MGIGSLFAEAAMSMVDYDYTVNPKNKASFSLVKKSMHVMDFVTWTYSSTMKLRLPSHESQRIGCRDRNPTGLLALVSRKQSKAHLSIRRPRGKTT